MAVLPREAYGGAAEEMGDDGAEQDQRGHAERDGLVGVVDLFEDEVVARLDGAADVPVEQADGETGDGQQGDEPEVLIAEVGGPLERDQEHGGGAAGQDADGGGDGQPTQQIEEDGELLEAGVETGGEVRASYFGFVLHVLQGTTSYRIVGVISAGPGLNAIGTGGFGGTPSPTGLVTR